MEVSPGRRNSMHRVRDRSINFMQTTNLKVKLSRPNGIACLLKRKLPRRDYTLAEEHMNVAITKGNEAFIGRSFETFSKPGNARTDRSK